jgi:hypothetical protein
MHRRRGNRYVVHDAGHRLPETALAACAESCANALLTLEDPDGRGS